MGSELSKTRHNGIVSYLKFLATGMAFICHAWIYSKDAFGLELQPNWQIFLKTPAWGVWIFFIIGEFLSGKGFLIDKKYELNIKGFVQYGINRFSYILLPTCIFIFISTALCYPEKLFDTKLLLRYITMTFSGQGGVKRNRCNMVRIYGDVAIHSNDTTVSAV